MKFLEKRFGSGRFFRLEPLDLEKSRDLTPQEKIALDRKDALLAEQATWRQPQCWTYDCKRKTVSWVREVCFDFKGEKADKVSHATISSADYPGPVPGFCPFCVDGPRQLAEGVFRDRPEIALGALPSRWWVVMTDGYTFGGECVQFGPVTLPQVIDSLT